MSREVKRVALNFDWPQRKVWEGYLMPERLRERECAACEGSGYSPYARSLHNQWYGYEPFLPESNGSTPYDEDTPAIRARAEHNVSQAPDFYGEGEWPIVREALRLARHFNCLSHHLNDDDVAALIEAKRLYDFTHTFVRGTGWVPKDPPVTPTAAQVNEWSLTGFGHDAINCHVVIEARCKRDGQADRCATCGGHGYVERYLGQRAEAEAWQRIEPPAGPGWQLWETVSEGSPVTPVFATADDLITWLVDCEDYRLSAAQQLVTDGHTIGSFMVVGMEGAQVVLDSAQDSDILDSLRTED